MNRCAVLLSLTLAVALGVSDPTPVPDTPKRFVHLELVGANLGSSASNAKLPGEYIRLPVLGINYLDGRVRVGTCLYSFVGVPPPEGVGEGLGGAFLPLVLGYTVFQRPRRTLFCYSMMPSVWIEGMLGLGTSGSGTPVAQPAARLALCGQVEFAGLGLGADAGLFSVPIETSPDMTFRQISGFQASVGLRLGTMSFAVGKRK